MRLRVRLCLSPPNLAAVLHPLDVFNANPVPVPQHADDCSCTERRNGNGKDGVQARDIGVDNDGNLLGREGIADLSGARSESEAGIDSGQVLDEVFDELVVEAGLGG